MPRTKKIKSLQGLGQKYGATVRKRYTRVQLLLKMKRKCPSCSSMLLRRESAGIWGCRKCGFRMAGGAYTVALAK